MGRPALNGSDDSLGRIFDDMLTMVNARREPPEKGDRAMFGSTRVLAERLEALAQRFDLHVGHFEQHVGNCMELGRETRDELKQNRLASDANAQKCMDTANKVRDDMQTFMIKSLVMTVLAVIGAILAALHFHVGAS